MEVIKYGSQYLKIYLETVWKAFLLSSQPRNQLIPNSPLTLALTPLPRVSADQPKGQGKVVKIPLPRPNAWCPNYKRWGQKLVDATA